MRKRWDFCQGPRMDSSLTAEPTEFEKLVGDMPESQWDKSPKVREWVKKNFRQRFVPEDLLLAMGIHIHDVPLETRRSPCR